jgi:hypothetical protein
MDWSTGKVSVKKQRLIHAFQLFLLAEHQEHHVPEGGRRGHPKVGLQKG